MARRNSRGGLEGLHASIEEGPHAVSIQDKKMFVMRGGRVIKDATVTTIDDNVMVLDNDTGVIYNYVTGRYDSVLPSSLANFASNARPIDYIVLVVATLFLGTIAASFLLKSED